MQDISFSLAAGEILGVIGRNGAGKSTLLKILQGVLLPDAGTVTVAGKVAGLLELGTGFDLNLSGRENIKVNGLMLGMAPAEIDAITDSIVRFSELQAVIDEPLRNYSSGMQMRLGFAVAIHAQPNVFLVDEALSVGDAHFQQKCMARIRQFREQGGSILFVSHDMNAVKLLCNRALVLDGGNIVMQGNPADAVNHYFQLIAGDTLPGQERNTETSNGYGNLQVKILSAELKGEQSKSHVIASGENAVLEIVLEAAQSSADLTIGMGIRDCFGQNLFGTNSHHLGVPLSVSSGETCGFQFRFPMLLAPGKYSISLALHEGPDHTRHCYHWWDNACTFEVSGFGDFAFGGLCNLQPRIEVLSR